VLADFYGDIGLQFETKRAMLAEHASQREWLLEKLEAKGWLMARSRSPVVIVFLFLRWTCGFFSSRQRKVRVVDRAQNLPRPIGLLAPDDQVLSLKEYGHVADWIQLYGANKWGPKN
jgi:hypothetical protein